MAERAVIDPPHVMRLGEAIRDRFAGSQVEWEQVRGDRYRFIVTWPEFDGMDHPERQRLVWDLAEQVLPPGDLLKISMILTLGNDDLPSN
jgi:hypothetical protein